MVLTVCCITLDAASFDCSKAETFVEMSICNDPELSRLDDKLSEAYKAAKAEVANPEMLKKEQILWLKEVRNKCTNVDCLKKVYEERISELNLKERKGLGEITGSYTSSYENSDGYGGTYLNIVDLGNDTIEFLCGWYVSVGGLPMRESYEGKAFDESSIYRGHYLSDFPTYISDNGNYSINYGDRNESRALYISVDLKTKRAGWSFDEPPTKYDIPKTSSRKPETNYFINK